MDDPANQAARESVIPVFLCPSEMVPDLFSVSLGDGEMDHEDSPDSEDSEIGDEVDEVDEVEHDGTDHDLSIKLARASYVGVFGNDEIEDGIGNGVFYRNSRVRFRQLARGQGNTLLVGERATRLGTATWVGAIPNSEKGPKRVVGTARRVPNDVLGHFDDFSSPHSAGVHFLMGDGAVQRISFDIDKALFQTLATRNGTLSEDDGQNDDGHEDDEHDDDD